MVNWNRRSIRLKGYNYCSNGIYFITICTQGKEKVFGRIENNVVVLNNIGKIARDEWIETTHIRTYVELDQFIIMPDHIHGILVNVNERDDIGRMVRSVGATGPVAPTLKSASLGSIIGQYKSVVTKKIRKMGINNFQWQRNYHEHVIRNEKELLAIQQYILNNPKSHQLNHGIPKR